MNFLVNNKKILTIIFVVIVITGAAAAVYFLRPQCPASCDDQNPCTQDTCSKATKHKCSNTKLSGPQPDCSAEVACGKETCKAGACQVEYQLNCCSNKICETGESYLSCAADCPNCEDNNDCTIDSYDHHKQQCVYAPVIDKVCCGNGICELEETHITCMKDCPDCNDRNECTKDQYDYYAQKCLNQIITPCCGNGVCDQGAETSLDCQADCPDCDDGNKMTGDEFNYQTQKCQHLEYYLFDDFNEGNASFINDSRWTILFPADKSNGVLTNKADQVYSNFGDQAWTDYFFEFKIRLAGAHVPVYVRSKFSKDDSSGAYMLFFTNSQLSLNKESGKEKSAKLKAQKYSFDPDTYYQIRIEAKGDNIKVYVNGGTLIDYTDNDPLLSGSVGIEALGQGIANSVYFDDVTVGPLK